MKPAAPPLEPRASVLEGLAALQTAFRQRRRVAVDALLEPDVTERIAAEMAALPFALSMNTPLCGSSRDSPRHWHFATRVEADRRVNRTPLRAFVHSAMRGPVRDLVAAIAGVGPLCDRPWRGHPSMVAHAFPRGSYIESHADSLFDRIGIVFHASRSWQPGWGGVLHFTEAPVESYVPGFGALHIFELGPANRHEVTMITGPEVRYTLIGRLREARR